MPNAAAGVGNRIHLDQGELLDLIGVQAGFLAQIYGKIKNGKTYLATVMAIETANSGQVVYVNWPIEWNGYDERDVWYYRLAGAFGFKRQFKRYPKENMHFADLSNLDNVHIDGVATGKNFYDWFASLTSCTCFFDEGHIYYDSYLALKMDLSKRLAILETAHYDRAVYIVSQRASAIHAVLRGNVNIFYKVEKIRDQWWIFKAKFRRIEFQETGADEKPNEERQTITNLETGEKTYGDYLWAENIVKYTGDPDIFRRYNSKYRRLGAKESQENLAEVYRLTIGDSWRTLFAWPKKEKRSDGSSASAATGDDILNTSIPRPPAGSASRTSSGVTVSGNGEKQK